MNFKDWQQWGIQPELESRYNIERVKGNLPEMESTKQLVNLISQVYKPHMRILDVGCNVGHYLVGLRKKLPDSEYTGVDAYEYYVNQAKKHFANDKHARFEVRDIFKPLFPNDPFDIVYCCNVILHLPDFRKPVANLLESTKQVCLIRTLLGDKTNIVKSPVTDEYDEEGNPLNFWYLNTWKKEYFSDFVHDLGWNVEFIEDEFSADAIQKEFEHTKVNKLDKGTRIVNGKQIIENVVCNWVWAKITK
jgi:ubiquinone/menaquinone biosynthesis C-methylase UbiE